MQITICGGGNAGHTLAGLLSAHPGIDLTVYLPYAGEAQRWRDGIQAQDSLRVKVGARVVLGKPTQISPNPEAVIPGSDVVILALPAFAHQATLEAVAPYLDANAWVGAMPARGGFDLCARAVLQDRQPVRIFGLQTLPWACRIIEYGREVSILGTKAEVGVAASPSDQVREIAEILHELLGLKLHPVSSFLALTLADTGQIIHPGIMYGLFHDWDGTPFSEPPLFYQGVTGFAAQVLQQLSDEVQEICREVESQLPGLNLEDVRPLQEWLLRSYPEEITDRTSLRSCFVTNRSYAGLTAPTQPAPGGYVLDFSARYLAEDVPHNLLATRGIAELAQVSTPTIDQVIEWAQEKLSKKYLVEGRLAGRDLENSRAPQHFGINTISHLAQVELDGKKLA